MGSSSSQKTLSILSPQQQALQDPIQSFLYRMLGGGGPQDTFPSDFFNSVNRRAVNTERRVYRDALLTPALEAFDREVAPRIAGGFANYGGTLSSRRGMALARGRTDVVRQSQASLASLIPQIRQQALEEALTPLHEAMRFTGIGTQVPGAPQANPLYATLNSLLGVAGFVGGAALSGGASVPASVVGWGASLNAGRQGSYPVT